jgi:serine/threonine protein kinase
MLLESQTTYWFLSYTFCSERAHHCMQVIISPMYEHGSLASVLLRGKNKERAKELSWEARLGFARDIARGMSFLHTRRRPLLHRDLKAANCFVDRHWTALVGDFGFSRDMQAVNATAAVKSEGPNNPRWLAPELMLSQAAGVGESLQARHSPATDVYSFGMLLYEILTWNVPWHRYNNWAISNMVGTGARPAIPPLKNLPGVPMDNIGFDTSGGLDKYLDLMRACWDADPTERPSFVEIEPRLESLLEQERRRNRGEQGEEEEEDVNE